MVDILNICHGKPGPCTGQTHSLLSKSGPPCGGYQQKQCQVYWGCWQRCHNLDQTNLATLKFLYIAALDGKAFWTASDIRSTMRS